MRYPIEFVATNLENIPASVENILGSDRWHVDTLLVLYGADLSKCTASVEAQTETAERVTGERVYDFDEYFDKLSRAKNRRESWFELGWKALITIGLISCLVRLKSLRRMAA